MKAEKVRELDAGELQKQVSESAEQLFRLRFQMSLGQAEGLKKYRVLRKDRARMLTILRERNVKPDASPAKLQRETAPAEGKRESRFRNIFRRAKKGK